MKIRFGFAKNTKNTWQYKAPPPGESQEPLASPAAVDTIYVQKAALKELGVASEADILVVELSKESAS